MEEKVYSRQEKIQFIVDNYLQLSQEEISLHLGITKKEVRNLVNNSRANGVSIPFRVKKLTEDLEGNRRCNSCEIFKPISEFSKHEKTTCKSCRKIKKKQWHETNKEKVKEYSKAYHEENREEALKKKKKYRESNKEKISDYAKEWENKNKPHRREYARKRESNKKKTK